MKYGMETRRPSLIHNSSLCRTSCITTPLLQFRNFGCDWSKKVLEIRYVSLTFFDCVSLKILKFRCENYYARNP